MDDCSGSLTAFGVVPFLLAANAESLGDGTTTGNALCTVDGLRTAALALMEPLPSPRTVFIWLGMSKVESQHKNLYTSLARARSKEREKEKRYPTRKMDKMDKTDSALLSSATPEVNSLRGRLARTRERLARV
jgi:hypothetical protein